MSKTLFEELKEGLEEAIEIEQGRKSPDAKHVHVMQVPDVKAIRASTGLSQSKFAKKFGLGLRTIQHWEAGRNHPVGPAAVLLKIIATNPQAVVQVVNHELCEG